VILMSSWNCSPIRVLSPGCESDFADAVCSDVQQGPRTTKAGRDFALRAAASPSGAGGRRQSAAQVIVQAVGVSRGWLFIERELRRKVDRRRGQLPPQRIERVPSAGRASDASHRGHLGTLTEGRGLRIENADPTAGLTVAYGREHEPRESSS